MNVFELTRALIDIESITNNEGRVGNYLYGYLEELAARFDGRVERIEVEPRRFNVFAQWGEPLVVTLSTHIDTVPSLGEHIAEAHKKNRKFRDAFAGFVTLCRASLNPELSDENVDEMLIQHLLTERLMRNLFQNPEFTTRNVIAAQVQGVIDALASGSFSTAQFLKKLDPYYNAIEREGANLSHFTEKQDFLNSVYEQFFQHYSPNVADTHGIVYTPREIVDYMCCSVEQALKEEFGYTLASPEVLILDPCTGTGNFIVNLIERMPGRALAEAYRSRLFANEVMLLPYYVASLNIEHAYYERINPGVAPVAPRDLSSNRRERAARKNLWYVADTGDGGARRCCQRNNRWELGQKCSGSPENPV